MRSIIATINYGIMALNIQAFWANFFCLGPELGAKQNSMLNFRIGTELPINPCNSLPESRHWTLR